MKKKQRKFAEHGGQSRVLAVVAFKVLMPIFYLLAAMASTVMAPLSVMASAESRIQAFCAGAGAGAVTAKPQSNVANLIARVSRDQGPEFEQTLNFAANSLVSTPTSLRTDRKIKFLDFHFRGRLTNVGALTLRTAPSLLNTQLFGLIQQITVRGQHLRYGAQTIFQMRGEDAAEYMALLYPNWTPIFTVAQNGGAAVRGQALDVTAAHFNDVDFTLPVPLFPPGLSATDIPFYCLHGPDWPGNLYVDVQFADGTALATVNGAAVTFTAFGSGAGNATVDILSERPLLGKDLMAKIRPGVTFRQSFAGQPSATVSGVSGSGIKLSDLTVGKDTSRIFLKTGVQSTGASAGVIAFGSLSDSIVTRTFISLDNRQLRFQNANADSALQDYMGRQYGRIIPIGYKMIDFVAGQGVSSSDNPKAVFQSSKLTAARKFELDGDVTAAANQIATVTQEMILGTPALLS